MTPYANLTTIEELPETVPSYVSSAVSSAHLPFTRGEIRPNVSYNEFELTGSIYGNILPQKSFPTLERRPSVLRSSCINKDLISEAKRIIADIDIDDPYNMEFQLPVLVSCVMQMWETAASGSQYHQDILAILENGVTCARVSDALTAEQLNAFREALIYLAFAHLVCENVQAIRSRFINAGFALLAFIEGQDIESNRDDE